MLSLSTDWLLSFLKATLQKLDKEKKWYLNQDCWQLLMDHLVNCLEFVKLLIILQTIQISGSCVIPEKGGLLFISSLCLGKNWFKLKGDIGLKKPHYFAFMKAVSALSSLLFQQTVVQSGQILKILTFFSLLLELQYNCKYCL